MIGTFTSVIDKIECILIGLRVGSYYIVPVHCTRLFDQLYCAGPDLGGALAGVLWHTAQQNQSLMQIHKPRGEPVLSVVHRLERESDLDDVLVSEVQEKGMSQSLLYLNHAAVSKCAGLAHART